MRHAQRLCGMDKVLQTVSRPFLQSLCRVRRHDASQLPYEFLHPFIRGAPSDDHRPRHSLFIGIGGLRRRRVAFFSFWLDLLLLRLVLRRRGGAVGLGLRARLFPASSSSRHFAVQLLCRVQPAGLLCGSLDDVKACCTNRGSNAAYVTHSFAVISAQRRRTEVSKCLACSRQASRSVRGICLQKLSACAQRALVQGGMRARNFLFFIDFSNRVWLLADWLWSR